MANGNNTFFWVWEGNDIIQWEVADDWIVGDLQDAVADVSNLVAQINQAYTEDVQRRREAWNMLAQELGINEGLVEVTDRIKVKGVADFYLNDSEDASYEELLNWKKWWIHNLPELSVRNNLLKFINGWSEEQLNRFFKRVMCMDTTKKWTWNFYLFKQDPIYYCNTNLTVHGISIDSSGVESDTFSKIHSCSLRRVYN